MDILELIKAGDYNIIAEEALDSVTSINPL